MGKWHEDSGEDREGSAKSFETLKRKTTAKSSFQNFEKKNTSLQTLKNHLPIFNLSKLCSFIEIQALATDITPST